MLEWKYAYIYDIKWNLTIVLLVEYCAMLIAKYKNSLLNLVNNVFVRGDGSS